MTLTSNGAILYTIKNILDQFVKLEPYENTERTVTILSQLIPEGIVLQFKTDCFTVK